MILNKDGNRTTFILDRLMMKVFHDYEVPFAAKEDYIFHKDKDPGNFAANNLCVIPGRKKRRQSKTQFAWIKQGLF